MTTLAIDSSDQNHDNNNDKCNTSHQQHQQKEDQPQDEQSPKTLTLESSSALDPPQIPDQNDPQQHTSLEERDQTQTQQQDDPDSVTPASPPPMTDSYVTASAATTTTKRNPPKRKKMINKRRVMQEKKSKKKLQVLLESLKPIPFVPEKTLDFSRHEALLKRLGLWDFVHMEFDRNVRTDLVAQLIATFNASSRCSYVNGVRIMVNRADLARALKLPARKDKGNLAENAAVEEENNDNESRRFVEEFLSTWVLLHEDTWMMPGNVLNWTNVIKEGKFEKVDWAGLIWFMVEKELAAPKLENCYYASHLQCLIKCQKEQLLMEETQIEIDVKEEEEDVKMEPEELEEPKMGTGGGKMEGEDTRIEVEDVEVETADLRMEVEDVKVEREDAKMEAEDVQVETGKVETLDGKMEVEDVQLLIGNMKMESELLQEHNIELSLGGQDNVAKELLEEESQKEKAHVGDVGEDVMEFEGKEEEEQDRQCGQWPFGEKSNAGDCFLQRCNLGNVGVMDFEEERKVQEEGEEVEEDEEEGQEQEQEDEEEFQDGGFHISPKGDALDGITSANLISSMEDVPNPFSSGVQIRDNLPGDFLASRGDSHIIPGNSSVFANGNKRGIGHGTDLSHDSFNGSNKRLRTQPTWSEKSSDLATCVDQIQYWAGKLRMMSAAKEQACEESSMNQQFLLSELQNRDRMIEQLEKAKVEEQHKRHMEVYRLEHELYTMGKLLENYRKALKETQRAFSEYRERCPVPDEPLYKDVAGSGGLVLSSMELERLRMKEEEEERMNRLLIEKKLKELEDEWIVKFEAHKDRVDLLDTKFLNFEKDVKLIKELLAKQKKSDVPESAPPQDE